MIGSDTDLSCILRQVLNAIGTGPSQFLIHKVVDLDLFMVPFRSPRLSVVLVKTRKLFLLGVDRDNRLASRKILFRPLVDVFELGVPVRMVSAFQRLRVGLKAVLQLFQKRSDRRMAHGMPQGLQLLRQPPQAIGRPSEWRLRTPSGTGVDQRFKVAQEGGIPIRNLFPSPSRSLDPSGGILGCFLPRLQLFEPGMDRPARHPGGLSHGGDPDKTQNLGFRRANNPPHSFIKAPRQQIESFRDEIFLHEGSVAESNKCYILPHIQQFSLEVGGDF